MRSSAPIETFGHAPALPAHPGQPAHPGTGGGLAMPFGRPMISQGERQAVLDVLAGDILTHGPRVKEFESAFEAFVGGPHAVATSNCTASLHLAAMFMDLKPGDEVIVPAMSHVATAHAVELCGARCVFVDAESATGNVDINLIELAISPRTRAIFVVHFLGVPADMDRINAIARQQNLLVIEDCALSLGATYKGVHTGLLGDAGCFSFYPVKHITTGEGGMTLTRRRDIADAARLQRAFGIERPARPATPGMYDVIQLGPNARMQEMSAALGVVQLARLPEFLEQRRANDAALLDAIADVNDVSTFAEPDERFVPSRYCRSIILSDSLRAHRAAIMHGLAARGIGTSIYYPTPIPLMSWYAARDGFRRDDFPVASWISESTIALPVGPHLSISDMRFIAGSLRDSIQQVKSIDLAA
jgi:perosamine synthetase